MKTPRQKLIDKLDEVFGNYIRWRDWGVCFTCGKQHDPNDRINLHPGHVFSRDYKALRWDERNVYAQCKGCNYRQNIIGNGEAMIWLVKKLGIWEVEKMEVFAHMGRKWTQAELKDMIELYKGKLDGQTSAT